jgi:hypothetical protein
LPISPDRMLVGSRDAAAALPTVAEIVESTVAQSAEFVVGTITLAELDALRDRIGRDFHEDRLAMFVLGPPEKRAEIERTLSSDIRTVLDDRVAARLASRS